MAAHGHPLPSNAWARARLTRGSSGGQIWEINADYPEARLSVGSASTAGWPVHAPGVAPVHYELFWDGNALWIADTQQAGNLFLDGQRVTDWVQIEGPAEIRFGQAAMDIETSAPLAQQMASSPSQARPVTLTDMVAPPDDARPSVPVFGGAAGDRSVPDLDNEATRVAASPIEAERTQIASPQIASPQMAPEPPGPDLRPRLGGGGGGGHAAEATKMVAMPHKSGSPPAPGYGSPAPVVAPPPGGMPQLGNVAPPMAGPPSNAYAGPPSAGWGGPPSGAGYAGPPSGAGYAGPPSGAGGAYAGPPSGVGAGPPAGYAGPPSGSHAGPPSAGWGSPPNAGPAPPGAYGGQAPPQQPGAPGWGAPEQAAPGAAPGSPFVAPPQGPEADKPEGGAKAVLDKVVAVLKPEDSKEKTDGKQAMPTRTWILLAVTIVVTVGWLLWDEPAPEATAPPANPATQAGQAGAGATTEAGATEAGGDDETGTPTEAGDSTETPSATGDETGTAPTEAAATQPTETPSPTEAAGSDADGDDEEGDEEEGPSLQRRAADAYIAGRYDEALAMYRQLAQEQPNAGAYEGMVAILERRLRERCTDGTGPGGEPCDTP